MSFPKSCSLITGHILAALGRTLKESQFTNSRSGRARRSFDYGGQIRQVVEKLEDLTLLSGLYTGIQVNDNSTVTIDKANNTDNIAASEDGDIHVAYGGSQVRVASSLNRGQTFQPSVLLANSAATYVAVETQGNANVYVAWVSNGSAFLSVSTDSGATFSSPQTVTTSAVNFRGINLAALGLDVYVQGSGGDNSLVFHNGSNGIGSYTSTAVDSLAYRKLEVDPVTSDVYSVGDYSDILIAKSTNSGATFSADASPTGSPAVSHSAVAISFGPTGDFAFVAGNNRNGNAAAKINLQANTATSLTFGNNSGNAQGRSLAADATGNVIDSYNEGGVLKYRVSQDLGSSFASAVTVASGTSSNVSINPVFQDVLVLYQIGGDLFLSTYENELKVDVAPVLATAGSISYTENDAPTAIATGVVVTDSDSATLTRATLTITNFVLNEDVLAFTNDGSTMGNISASYNNQTGVLKLSSASSTATKAQWQSALRSVKYSNTSDTPTTTTRSVNLVISDGIKLSNTITNTISITAVNDAPVAQASSVTTNEDTPKSFAASDFLYTDAENNTPVSITVSGLALASGDTLTVNQGAGAITVTNNMTITAAQIATLIYTPALNANGAARSTFSFKSNDADAGTVAATMTLNVTAINDAPVAQASSVTVTEDTTKTFAASDFLFTDVEGDSLVSITISGLSLASGDTLTVNQGAGAVTVTNGMTITVAQIASMIYTPAADGNGTPRSTITFKGNDTDLGTVSATMSINITGVNDPPVAQTSNVTTNEEVAKTFAVSDFTIADPEGDALVSITVSGISLASGDTLTVNQGAGAVTLTNGTTVTAAQISTLIYTPALNGNGTPRSTFLFVANDAATGTVSATMNININPINDVPVAQNSTITVTEDRAETFEVSDFLFTDVESNSLVSITVNNVTIASGDTLTVDQGSGAVTVTNGMTITAAQIATMVYTPALNANGAARSTFSFKVNDAGVGTVAAIASIDVTAVNDLPVAQASSVTTNEDTSKTFAAADFLFTDVESDSLVSLTISGLSIASGDTLRVDQGSGLISVTNGMTITAAQIATMIYTPAANANGAALSSLSFKANDDGSGTVAATMSINVTPVNDVPVAQTSSVTTNEDIAKTFAASDFLFSDVENNSLVSITVSGINLASGDTLTVDQGSGAITVTDGMIITAAQIATLIYTPAVNANGSSRSAFDFKVNDANAGTVSATTTINVTAVNDVPVAQVNSVATNEDTAKTFASSDFLFTDVENNSLVSITVSGVSLASGDTLTVNQGAGAITVTNGMTITAAQIASLVYTPASNANGSARSTFNFKVNDTDSGTVAAAMTINVTAVNDVPVAQVSSVSTNEDTAKTFAASDFLFNDVESDSLVSITVSGLSLASGDTLTVNQGAGAVTVTNGMTITAAEVATMLYTPSANANGSARSTFNFKVNDAGAGTVAATMSINVTAVNDLPVAQTSSVTTSEDIAKTFVASDFLYTDVENNSLVSVTISNISLASGDTLTVDQGSGAITVTNGMTITAAQLSTFIYTSATNQSGAARSTFDFAFNDADAGVVSATMTINVTAVNDAPVVASVETTAVPYAPAAASTSITSTLTLSDVDGTDITGATVRIAVNFQSGDQLLFTNTANITGSWDEAGTLTLTGTDTLANYESALRTVRFVSSSQSAAARTVRFTVNDGQSANNLSNIAARTVSGNLQLVGTTLNVYGTALADTVTVTSTSTLTVVINGTTQTYTPSAVTALNIYGYVGNDTITVNSLSSGTALIVDGGDNNDVVSISSSVSHGVILIGGDGNDSLTGGAGNDTYLFDTDTAQGSDVINESRGGTDTLDFSETTTRSITIDLSRSTSQVVNSALSLTLSAAATFENVIGGILSDTMTGNTLSNVLTGGAGDDIYVFDTDLALGSDTIIEAGGGTDTIDFSSTSTRVVVIDLSRATSQVVNAGLTLTLSSGTTMENALGGTLSDTFTGNSQNNIFTGGAGNDIYRFDTDLTLGNDTIREAGGGIDTLNFSDTTTRRITIDLSAATLQVVNPGLTLTLSSGATVENVVGGTLGDTFTGNALDNTLTGGAGDDTYLFDTDVAHGSDTIVEAGGGTDTLDFSGTTTRSIIIDLSKAASQAVNVGLALTLSSAATIENIIGGDLNDTLTGNSLDNSLAGGLGNDTYIFDADSTLGSDTIDESAGGTDRLDFSLTTTRNVAVDLSNALSQVVNAALTLILSSETTIENVTGGTLNDTLVGNSLDNVLTGGDGNDNYIFDTDLAHGSDTIIEVIGGVDRLDFSDTTTRNISIDLSRATSQVVNAGLTLTLTSGSTMENVIGGSLADTIIGNTLANSLTGGAGNDTYIFDTDLAQGSDTIIESGGGTDVLDFGSTTTRNIAINLSTATIQVVNANLSLTLSSATTIENVIGGTLGDTITGNSLDNVLAGGFGNDLYVFDTDLALGSDTIDETAGGADTLDFSGTTTRGVTIDLSNATSQVVNAGLELTLSSGTTMENVKGGAIADSITGNSLANTLTGGAGNDTYNFDTDLALGSDTISEPGGGVDVLDFSGTTTRNVTIDLLIATPQVVNAGLTLTLGSSTTIENVVGGSLNDTLTGNSLGNVLTGGAGNDTYLFDTDLTLGSDTIVESGGGTDKLDFGSTTTRNIAIDLSNAASQVVNAGLTLTLSSDSTIENATGGTLNDTFTGNSLSNLLTGGTGNDTYNFDTDLSLGSDTIDESRGGTDTLNFAGSTTRSITVDLSNAAAQTVNAGLTLTLSSGATMENVVGSALNDSFTGNSLSNTLTGGAGDDTYVYDTDLTHGSDTIVEAGGGTDVLDFSGTTTRSVSIDLSIATSQVVNAGLSLILSSATTIENVTGTGLNDTFRGNSLSNTLTGGAGNDIYVFDTDLAHGSDTINEAGGGTDVLDFSGTTTRNVSIDLSNAVSQVVNAGLTLTLSSATAIENAIAGALNDTLIGNSLSNVLTGGAGDDSYMFNTNTALGSDSIADTLGADSVSFVGSTAGVSVNLGLTTAQTVNSNLTLTLGSATAFESVTGGSGDDILIGNTVNNSISGGDGDDVLSGGAGNDVLQGGDGKNVMIGGAGADTLTGGTDEDLLIGARYILESDTAALSLIRAEWTSASSFSDRIAHLLGTVSGGSNGTTTLRSGTVKEDNVRDTLTGSDSDDWYLVNNQGTTLANRDTVNTDIDSLFTEISSWL